MVLNFLSGGAAINALAGSGGIELRVVDIGVATPLPFSEELIGRRVANGTRNFCKEPAMTEGEMLAALEAGVELACNSADAGCDLLGFGEMGIGNQQHRRAPSLLPSPVNRSELWSAPARGPMTNVWPASARPSCALSRCIPIASEIHSVVCSALAVWRLPACAAFVWEPPPGVCPC